MALSATNDTAWVWAREVVEWAWSCLPSGDRHLLESLRADQWEVVSGPLGDVGDHYLRSAGEVGWAPADRRRLNSALGLWMPELRIVLIRHDAPEFAGFNDATREHFLSRIAWHEWGHALSIEQCTQADVRNGQHLLDLAPKSVRELVRAGGYRECDYTHEVIAETYVLLIRRHLEGASGKPPWLHDEIYDFLQAKIGWSG